MSSNLDRVAKLAVRKIAVSHLAHALRLAQTLHDDMHAWWAAAGAQTEWVLSDDRLSMDLVIDVPAPPVEDWRLRANDVIQNLRTALDALARNIAVEFVGLGRKSDISFPTAMTKNTWDEWKGHRVKLPTEVVERFRTIQPYVTQRVDLDGLRRISNLSKHEFTVTASLQPQMLDLAGTTTLEGVGTDADAAQVTVEMVDPVFSGGRQTVLRARFPRPVVSHTDDSAGYALTVWLTVPSFTFPADWPDKAEVAKAGQPGGTTDIGLLETLNDWQHEVSWVIAYITGQYSSPTIPPPGGINL